MATDKPRFSVTFTDDSFKKIQRYKKENNISTQSKAVARLVEIAISKIESENSNDSRNAGDSAPGEKAISQDLSADIEQQYGSDARKALSMYAQLDQDDRGEIRGEMKQMLKADKYKNAPCSKGDPAKVV